MPMYARMSVNFVYKLVVFPSIIFLSSFLFPYWISFQNLLPIVSLSGLFLLIGIIADETILPLFGNIKSTLQGFLFMTAVVWLSGWVFPSATVHVWGALIAGTMLGIAELLMHQWILKQREPHTI